MNKTRLILTGGFLGAGKTTLIWSVALKLIKQGKRVGLITNDQAPELVDSRLLAQSGLSVAEVAGSCFCCNFNGFTGAIQDINNKIQADVILAEPVGSCADLSATIIQPLKKFHSTDVLVSPFTVLADPERLGSILKGGNGGLHDDAAYIYVKQLEEADVILITKTDTLTADSLAKLQQETERRFRNATVMTASANADKGIDQWIEFVSSRTESGRQLLDIDYDRYAHGEAVLGWLNGTVNLHGSDADWDALLSDLMNGLKSRLTAENLRTGHVKVIAENGKQYAVGNLTGSDCNLTLRSSAGRSNDLHLIINARVECTPEYLDRLVRDELVKAVGGRYTDEVTAWRYLQPGRPNPTHRFSETVK